jgi:quinol monooxygenase YgiN
MNNMLKTQAAQSPQRSLRKIVHIAGKHGTADALRAALLELESATQSEAGCIGFSFYQSLSAPSRFLLIEEFAGEAALAAHMQEPHTKAFFARDLVAGIEPVAKDWLS